MTWQVVAATMGAKLLAALPALGSDAEVDAAFRALLPDLLSATHSEFAGWLLSVPPAALPAVDAAAAAVSAGDSATRRGIWELSPSGAAVPPAPADAYAVLWAHLPWPLRFQNVLAVERATRTAALQQLMRTQQPVLTGLLPHLCSDALGDDAPGSIVYVPIWTQPRPDASLARQNTTTARLMATVDHSYCAVSFHWRRLLQDALAHRITGVAVVLHAPGDKAYTFVANMDGTFEAVGVGDVSSALVAPSLRRYARDIPLHAPGGGAWRVTVLPTHALL